MCVFKDAETCSAPACGCVTLLIGSQTGIDTSDIDCELHATVSCLAGITAGIRGLCRADDQPPHAPLRLQGDVVSGLDLTAVLIPCTHRNGTQTNVKVDNQLIQFKTAKR